MHVWSYMDGVWVPRTGGLEEQSVTNPQARMRTWVVLSPVATRHVTRISQRRTPAAQHRQTTGPRTDRRRSRAALPCARRNSLSLLPQSCSGCTVDNHHTRRTSPSPLSLASPGHACDAAHHGVLRMRPAAPSSRPPPPPASLPSSRDAASDPSNNS